MNFCLERQTDGSFQLKRNHGYYCYQCQLQIFATEHSFCYFMVWMNEELDDEHITLDEDFITTT
jgi:hypothetical protein